MANQKISELTDGGVALATDDIPAVRSGANVRVKVNSLPAGVTSPGTGALAFNTGALTASRPTFDVEQTWNNAGVTFTGMRFNVTDTASNAASLLADWQVGGVSRAAFRKDGRLAFGVNSCAINPGNLDSNNLVFGIGSATFGFDVLGSLNGMAQIRFGTGWGTTDTVLLRDGAANTLAQRNGTSAQTFRIYRSFVDGSNLGYTALRQDATTGFIVDSVNTGSVGAPTNLLDVRSNAVSFLTLTASTRVLRHLKNTTDYTDNVPATYVRGYLNNVGITTQLLFDDGGGFSGGQGLLTGANGAIRWNSLNRTDSGSVDLALSRSAAGVLSLNNGSTGGASLESTELGADPAAPATNAYRLYAKDNGSGKTQLCVRFATGAVQVLATEP